VQSLAMVDGLLSPTGARWLWTTLAWCSKTADEPIAPTTVTVTASTKKKRRAVCTETDCTA
jgi:hypothetical protein